MYYLQGTKRLTPMPRPKIPTKAKRNNFTLTLEAQAVIDALPNSQKSKFVSAAIVQAGPVKERP
jgi:hypothetical protein